MVIVLALDSPHDRSSAFCYGYLFMRRSNPVLLISQIYIQLFTILYYVVLYCFDQPLIHYSEIKYTCGYALALDYSRGCSLACGCGYLLMKHSSPALIRTEPRSHAEKKNLTKLVAIKICRPYLFQMTCSADRPRFFPSIALCNVSGFSYQPTNSCYRLVSHCYNSLLTFSVMLSR